MPASYPDSHYTQQFTLPALSLERSTIKPEYASDTLLRADKKHPHREHVTSVGSLFSPIHNHHFESSPSPSPSIAMSITNNDDRLPSPGSHQQTTTSNRMSVSTLCSPPPSSSLPPHIARGSYESTTVSGVMHSPSSVTSMLSPDAQPRSLSITSSVPPRSPSIVVLDSTARSASPSQPHHTMTRTAPFVTTATSHVPADSLLLSPGAGGKRKRTSPSTGPTDGSGDAVEFDERTKTWKHATGFRRDLTADKLTQPDAPTRKKRQSSLYRNTTASGGTRVTSAKSTAAHRNRSGSTNSQRSGSGDSIANAEGDSGEDDDDELIEAATTTTAGLGVTFDLPSGGSSRQPAAPGSANKRRKAASAALAHDYSPSPSSPGADAATSNGGVILNPNGGDPEEISRLEKKRRQNTQAARRSRIRKAEEVQKLQNLLVSREQQVADLEREVGDVKRERERVEGRMRDEVLFGGVLKGVLTELLGDDKGSEVIGAAEARWRAIVKSGSGPAISAPSPVETKEVGKMEVDDDTGSGS